MPCYDLIASASLVIESDVLLMGSMHAWMLRSKDLDAALHLLSCCGMNFAAYTITEHFVWDIVSVGRRLIR